MADIGHGASISFTGWTGDITSVEIGGIERDAVEVTHMGSTGGYREFIPGLIDAGEVTVEGLFDPNDEPPMEGAAATLTITWPTPSGGAAGATFAASAFLTSFSASAPQDDTMTFEATWKLTGDTTWTDST